MAFQKHTLEKKGSPIFRSSPARPFSFMAECFFSWLMGSFPEPGTLPAILLQALFFHHRIALERLASGFSDASCVPDIHRSGTAVPAGRFDFIFAPFC